MRLIFILLTCITLFGGLPFATAQDITLTDATGTEVTITSLDRIVSANGDVTEIIDALGFYDSLVAVDNSSTFPEKALDELPSVGFGRRLALEPIVAQNPSVFFCTQACGPADVIQQLRDLDIPVVIIPDREDGGLALPAEKIAMTAEALGVPDLGAALIEKVEREIQWVSIATSNVDLENKPAVLHLYVRNMGLQLAGGAGTPAQYLIEGAGGIDAGMEAGVNQYLGITPEIILSAYPDFLLLTNGSIESAGGLDVVLEIQGLADTPAVQNNQIIVMDTQFLLGMSTHTGQAMMELAHTLHPEMTWEVTVENPPTQVYATNESLLATVQNLGFHAELYTGEAVEGSVILAFEGDEAPAEAVIVTDSIPEIAAALQVPGRGAALEAYLQ